MYFSIAGNKDAFNACHLSPVKHLFSRKPEGHTGMVGASRQNPCFRSCFQRWLRLPQHPRHREIRHIMINFPAFRFIQNETEPPADINDAGDDG